MSEGRRKSNRLVSCPWLYNWTRKELNISDADSEEKKYRNPKNGNTSATYESKETGRETFTESNIEDNLDDIEAALTQLKKKLGLLGENVAFE